MLSSSRKRTFPTRRSCRRSSRTVTTSASCRRRWRTSSRPCPTSSWSRAAALEQAKSQLESDIATRQNSLFYHAANAQNLKDQGVLSPVLKRLRDMKGVTFNESLDLRAQTSIDLVPQNFGLEQIRMVRLL